MQKAGVAKLDQEQMDTQVQESASRMMNSAAFGQVIIFIVYLPILALVGIEGKMFGPMAQTVMFAIVGAFLLSLTYVPMMSALFLSKKTTHKRNLSDRMMDFFQRLYKPLINSAIHHRGIVITIAVALLAVAVFAFSRLQNLPKLPELILSIHPEQQYAIRALKAGAVGYLSKDAAPEELVKAVQRVL
jgi:cobalt-zinc-cadmium resistance protein CzcA